MNDRAYETTVDLWDKSTDYGRMRWKYLYWCIGEVREFISNLGGNND